MAKQKKTTFGVIVGNRGFFPSHLAKSGRTDLLAALKRAGYGAVCLTEKQTAFGSVETYDDAKKCAALFKKNREKIDGIIVSLPNFGDERGVADTLKLAGLDVPVLVQATPDTPGKMTIANRRDSFCGKMSVCNNLRQYGIKYSLTDLHTVAVDSAAFSADLDRFAGICRVVGGLKGARFGAIGARPEAFNTVRYSEKLLENTGISVVTVDLFDIFGRVQKLGDKDKVVTARLAEIKDYINTKTGKIPKTPLTKMAKFAVVVEEWMAERDLDASAVQCWTAMEEFFGVVPCTCMSMMSNALLPSACEVDIAGTVAMYSMVLASGKASALLDWNNNYGPDPDKCVVFHCSNLPADVFERFTMDYQEIIAGTVGKANTYGTVVGRIKAVPFTYTRVTTDDLCGKIRAYTGEGRFTEDKCDTFGGYGVAEIDRLQALLQYICDNGFEHHVAMNQSQVSTTIAEAFDKYMGWDVYRHV
jgi:L-fucose isomerase-like protein